MPRLVDPHGGGPLKALLLEGEARANALERARTLPSLRVSSREKGDLIMLGVGGFTPLDGFMTHGYWERVCDGMKLANGLFWPIPITLSTGKERALSIRTGSEIALIDPDSDEILATMRVSEKYGIDKKHECMMIFRTADSEHPGVKMVLEQGDVNLAGPRRVAAVHMYPELVIIDKKA